MSTKNTKNKPELVLPEMEKSQTFNLSLNKDDLVDLYIDTVLTTKEAEIQNLKDRKKDMVESLSNIKEVAYKAHSIKLFKRVFGKDANESLIKGCNQLYNKFFIKLANNVEIAFYKEEDFCEIFPNAATKKLNEGISQIDSELRVLEKELDDIKKSNKRLKAKLIKSLLASTEDGVAILNHISNLKDVKLLPNG